MSFSDPISEMLTKIRNAQNAQLLFTDVFVSREKLGIVKILKEKNFISDYLVDEEKKKLVIFLKYLKRKAVINGLKRISKPGVRRYVTCDKIPLVLNGFGIAILSTSKGILDDISARKMGVGGEVLCFVW
ncbi:MAG: 30S ribosomal protein S8 [Chlamydiae bacterium SM23_39]|nr:MAG: 30S ribosomal protein S8 [Chlamydiae bacterium SM23_39]